MLPFIGALVVSFSPQRRAAEWGVLFAALTTLCMLSLISAFYQADYSAAIFLIPICISFDTAEKRRYATYLILNRRFSFEF
ncbi:TPA: hypothetical protein QA857_000111 [Shigella flexneri]|nr:hypothetical protein [Shigella flexneri]HDQ5908570.1 hypothetical protein [Shigella flexneri]